MKTIINDYCIRMFTGYDDYRPYLSQVNLENGFLYATNAHIAAKINVDFCIKKYESIEKFPNVETVILQHEKIESKIVNLDSLFSDLMEIECCFKPELIKCEDCEGDGTAICEHCDSEYECKKCKGKGEVDGTKLILSGENNVTIFGKKYKLHLLELIIKTAVFIGVKEIEISNGNNSSLFKVGNFTILLMHII